MCKSWFSLFFFAWFSHFGPFLKYGDSARKLLFCMCGKKPINWSVGSLTVPMSCLCFNVPWIPLILLFLKIVEFHKPVILKFFLLADTFGELILFSIISIKPTYVSFHSALLSFSIDLPWFFFFRKLKSKLLKRIKCY